MARSNWQRNASELSIQQISNNNFQSKNSLFEDEKLDLSKLGESAKVEKLKYDKDAPYYCIMDENTYKINLEVCVPRMNKYTLN